MLLTFLKTMIQQAYKSGSKKSIKNWRKWQVHIGDISVSNNVLFATVQIKCF